MAMAMAGEATAPFMALAGDTRNTGASMTRRSMSSWTPYLGSPRTDWGDSERNTIIARSRDAFRNQLIARAALTRINSSVIGTGLRLQSRPNFELLGITALKAEALAGNIEREFALWADSAACDAEWTFNFYQQQGLVQLSALMSGDVFTATPMVERPGTVYSLVLQHIEADRVGNPHQFNAGVFQGVETDAMGAPMYYHISNIHPADQGVIRYERVPVFGANTGRRRITHVFDKERPGQVRGFPILAPILEPLKQLDRYGDAELMAAVVSAMFTVFITKNPDAAAQVHPLGSAIGASGSPQAKDDDISLGNGAIVDLGPGEAVDFANPGRPNQNYAPFFTEFCRQIGAALELPVDELLLSYRDSYSAARAAMLQAWRMYKRRRLTIALMFCQPVFEVWFDEAVARGRIKVRGYDDPVRRKAYTQAVWRGPARGAIDELKEAQAAEKRMAIGVSTLEIEAAELAGEDWLYIANQRGIERGMRSKLGLSDPSDPKPNTNVESDARAEDKSAA